MTDAAAIAEAKARLIARWDRVTPDVEAPDEGMARFENLAPQRRPRGGLAIGHSVDPKTRVPRLELRVTADKGPNFEQARRLVADAQAEGFGAVLRSITSAFAPTAPPGPPLIAGRRRPLHLGASISHVKSQAGSLGGFVKVDGGIGVVSCGHVLARFGRKWANVDDPVHQPGMSDQAPVVAGNRVGKLTELFAPFIEAQSDNLDVAVACLDGGHDHTGNVIPDLPCVPLPLRGCRIGAPLEAGELIGGTRVIKVGRTTGLTEGTVSLLDVQNFQVGFGTGRTREKFTFSGVYEVLWDEGVTFAQGGDSGSLVMTQEGLNPIGLHFASAAGRDGANYSYVVPWPRIRTTFGLEFLG